MASKVMVKLPVAPFGQVNKSKAGEVVLTARPQQELAKNDQTSKTPEQVRLEQNIRFLQDQHQLMLAGLHAEIEKLKARNRELQFQLIFGKGPVSSSSPSPSSPEDEAAKHKLYTSPKISTNTTPLQVELLEKELGELKIHLQEQESRNLYLSAIVEEQKKQLERYDRRREKEQQQRANGPGESEADLLRKLEDAESLIRRLRRENSDLRREHHEMAAHGSHHEHHRDNNGFQSPRGHQNHRASNSRGHRSNNGHNSGQYNHKGGPWFAPFSPVWHGKENRPVPDRSHNSTQEHQGTTLPDIPRHDATQNHDRYFDYRPRIYNKASNNNQYHHNDVRKYRGGHHKGNKPS